MKTTNSDRAGDRAMRVILDAAIDGDANAESLLDDGQRETLADVRAGLATWDFRTGATYKAAARRAAVKLFAEKE